MQVKARFNVVQNGHLVLICVKLFLPARGFLPLRFTTLFIYRP
jgi:hypothetical protein